MHLNLWFNPKSWINLKNLISIAHMQFGPVLRAAHFIYFIFHLKSAQLAAHFWPSKPTRGSSPSSNNTRATTAPAGATAPCAANCHSPPGVSSGIEPAYGRLHFPSSLSTIPLASPPITGHHFESAPPPPSPPGWPPPLPYTASQSL
jgi:hypothetical protein